MGIHARHGGGPRRLLHSPALTDALQVICNCSSTVSSALVLTQERPEPAQNLTLSPPLPLHTLSHNAALFTTAFNAADKVAS